MAQKIVTPTKAPISNEAKEAEEEARAYAEVNRKIIDSANQLTTMLEAINAKMRAASK